MAQTDSIRLTRARVLRHEKRSAKVAFYTENSWHNLAVSGSQEQEYCATKRDVPQWQACPEWDEVSSELAYETNLTVHLDSTFLGVHLDSTFLGVHLDSTFVGTYARK